MFFQLPSFWWLSGASQQHVLFWGVRVVTNYTLGYNYINLCKLVEIRHLKKGEITQLTNDRYNYHEPPSNTDTSPTQRDFNVSVVKQRSESNLGDLHAPRGRDRKLQKFVTSERRKKPLVDIPL